MSSGRVRERDRGFAPAWTPHLSCPCPWRAFKRSHVREKGSAVRRRRANSARGDCQSPQNNQNAHTEYGGGVYPKHITLLSYTICEYGSQSTKARFCSSNQELRIASFRSEGVSVRRRVGRCADTSGRHVDAREFRGARAVSSGAMDGVSRASAHAARRRGHGGPEPAGMEPDWGASRSRGRRLVPWRVSSPARDARRRRCGHVGATERPDRRTRAPERRRPDGEQWGE